MLGVRPRGCAIPEPLFWGASAAVWRKLCRDRDSVWPPEPSPRWYFCRPSVSQSRAPRRAALSPSHPRPLHSRFPSTTIISRFPRCNSLVGASPSRLCADNRASEDREPSRPRRHRESAVPVVCRTWPRSCLRSSRTPTFRRLRTCHRSIDTRLGTFFPLYYLPIRTSLFDFPLEVRSFISYFSTLLYLYATSGIQLFSSFLHYTHIRFIVNIDFYLCFLVPGRYSDTIVCSVTRRLLAWSACLYFLCVISARPFSLVHTLTRTNGIHARPDRLDKRSATNSTLPASSW